MKYIAFAALSCVNAVEPGDPCTSYEKPGPGANCGETMCCGIATNGDLVDSDGVKGDNPVPNAAMCGAP